MPTPGILIVISTARQSDDASAASAFEAELKEAHRSRRVFLEGGGASILSHEHYHAKDTGEPVKTALDIYEVDDIEPITSGVLLMEEGGDGPIAHAYSYVYRMMSTHGLTAQHASELPQDLVLVAMDPPMMHLDDTNRWYEDEHIPLLLKVPGYLSACRGSLVWSSPGSEDVLKYMTLHRYAAQNGLGTSEEYKQATSTPWRTEVMGYIGDKKSRSTWTFVKTT